MCKFFIEKLNKNFMKFFNKIIFFLSLRKSITLSSVLHWSLILIGDVLDTEKLMKLCVVFLIYDLPKLHQYFEDKTHSL